MKRDFEGMLLIFVGNKLSVLFTGEDMRTYWVPEKAMSRVSCVLRRTDTLLAHQMVDYLRKVKINEAV